jgi:hypothetical protein
MAEQLSVIRILAALPLVVLAASCASIPPGRDDSADLAKELTGKVAEKSRSCISLDDARSAKIFDDAILYRTSRRLNYVNAAKGCRPFDPDPIFINEVRGGSQLCRGDLVRTVSRSGGIPGPFCVLGDFTPYRAPKR